MKTASNCSSASIDRPDASSTRPRLKRNDSALSCETPGRVSPRSNSAIAAPKSPRSSRQRPSMSVHLMLNARSRGARLDEPLVRGRRLLRRERQVAELAAHPGGLDPLLASLAVAEPQAVQPLARLRAARQLLEDRRRLVEPADGLPRLGRAQERVG